MNKKGFTLIEILIVISLIGVLLLFVMPNLLKIFSNSVKSTMKVQENELKDSGIMYLEDFCKTPLPGRKCPNTISRNNDYSFSGYVTLDTLVLEDYMDEITLENTECKGCVIYNKNKASAYITCNEDYSTESSTDYKNICNLN